MYNDYRHPKASFARIFDRIKHTTMEKQYCKVGTVTPMTSGRQAIAILEFQYNNFLEKASHGDIHLREYFEQKAIKLNKILEHLV